MLVGSLVYEKYDGVLKSMMLHEIKIWYLKKEDGVWHSKMVHDIVRWSFRFRLYSCFSTDSFRQNPSPDLVIHPNDLKLQVLNNHRRLEWPNEQIAARFVIVRDTASRSDQF